MTEESSNFQHTRQLKQKHVDATPVKGGIKSLRKESDHTISTASFVLSSDDDTTTVNSSATNTPPALSYSPSPNLSEESPQSEVKVAFEKDVQHHNSSSFLSSHRGSLTSNETPNRPDLNNCPVRQKLQEEEERTVNRVSPIIGQNRSLGNRQPIVGSVPDPVNLSRLSSSSSGGSNTVTVQVVRPCPVKKGPAPTAVTILSPLPVQCVPPTPAESVSAAPYSAKLREDSQQQQQQQRQVHEQEKHQKQQQSQKTTASKPSEQEAPERRQQLEEAAAKRHQKALEEEAQRRQQQIQQEEFRRRLQQQQLQTQSKQREVAAAKLREQQQKEKEEAKRRQANQCAFPSREPQQQPKSQAGRVSGMGSSDRGMPHSAHVQIGGRQAANGPVRENGSAPYHHPHGPPHQQQGRQNMRTISTDTTSAGIKTPHGSIDMDSSVAGAPPPAPLFERIVSEEVQELKEYGRIIESQSARLAELQRIHDDLERRLEMQTKDRMELEATLEKRERMWAGKCEGLEKERDQWKSMVQVERTKNERLLDQVYRKDKEIHRMIQRKYDSERHPPHGHSHHPNEGLRALKRAGSDRGATQHGSHSGAMKASTAAIGERSNPNVHHKSPHEILAASGSVEAVRERNVTNSLLDFFGM